ncbi:MAG: hypothetical protein M0Z52_03795 [Actinomycetota bacterium]|nr:hypothetical protein [Actinomycetota bacterium]
MHCETCESIEEVDEIEPPCKTPQGCPIPPLTPDAQRLQDIRMLLTGLKELGAAPIILKTFAVSLEDLKMLARVEREVKALTRPREAGRE